jgi:hypothetical protein
LTRLIEVSPWVFFRYLVESFIARRMRFSSHSLF